MAARTSLRPPSLLLAAAMGLLTLASTSRAGELGAPERPARSRGSKWVSPLLDCAPPGGSKSLRPFEAALKRRVLELSAREGVANIAVYFRDLQNGPWFGVNEKAEYLPASLLKLPLVVSLLLDSESKPEMMNDVLKIDAAAEAGFSQRFTPRSRLVSGSTHTLTELMSLVLRDSDNAATETLANRYGAEGIRRLYDELDVITPDDGVPDFLRVTDYARIFSLLYNAGYLSRAHSEWVLDELTRSGFRGGLTRQLPGDLPVAHKYGERELPGSGLKQLHDCGVVFFPGRPYTLCVMTQGTDYDQLSAAIGDLSSWVYQQVSGQFPAK